MRLPAPSCPARKGTGHPRTEHASGRGAPGRRPAPPRRSAGRPGRGPRRRRRRRRGRTPPPLRDGPKAGRRPRLFSGRVDQEAAVRLPAGIGGHRGELHEAGRRGRQGQEFLGHCRVAGRHGDALAVEQQAQRAGEHGPQRAHVGGGGRGRRAWRVKLDRREGAAQPPAPRMQRRQGPRVVPDLCKGGLGDDQDMAAQRVHPAVVPRPDVPRVAVRHAAAFELHEGVRLRKGLRPDSRGMKWGRRNDSIPSSMPRLFATTWYPFFPRTLAVV